MCGGLDGFKVDSYVVLCVAPGFQFSLVDLCFVICVVRVGAREGVLVALARLLIRHNYMRLVTPLVCYSI